MMGLFSNSAMEQVVGSPYFDISTVPFRVIL